MESQCLSISKYISNEYPYEVNYFPLYKRATDLNIDRDFSQSNLK